MSHDSKLGQLKGQTFKLLGMGINDKSIVVLISEK